MPSMEITADFESVSAVVQFRDSVSKLKLVSEDVPEEVIMNSEEVFAKCSDVLKHIYSQNEQSEEIQSKLQTMHHSAEQQVAEVFKIDKSLEVLVAAEKCMRRMKEIESHFAEKDFYRLVVKVEQLRLELDDHPFRQTNVFTGIARQSKKWLVISSEWLGACVDQCITIAQNEMSISCAVDQKYLKNLCKEASYDLLLKIFVIFSGQLLSSVVLPILRRSVVSLTANDDVLVVNLEKDDLTDSPDRFDCGTESAVFTVIPSLISVFKFVKEQIFVHMKTRKFYYELVAQFGAHIIHDMSSLLCSIFLRPLLPNKPSKLGNFHHLISQILDLQNYLEETGFQPEPNKLLEDFMKSHVNIVLEKYETTLLVQARDMLLMDWEELSAIPTQTPVQLQTDVAVKLPSRFTSDSIIESLFGSSSSGLFTLPPCQVSSLLLKFVVLVHEVLDEVKTLVQNEENSDESERAWLIGILRFLSPCARHVADLFLAFLPDVTDSTSLFSAAVILCDCSYLANSLLSLEAEFISVKKDFPICQNSLPPFIFLDLVQPARCHGWTAFRRALERTRSQLIEVDLDPWSQGASGKLMASGFRLLCEQSLATVLSKLTHVTLTLRKVLPTTLAASALALLLDAVLATIVSQLSSRADISDAESRVHFEMLTQFSDDLTAKVGVIAAATSETTSKNAPLLTGKVYLMKLCPESMPRFLDMISLLDSDLASILNRWADGAGPLASSFRADELRTVIRALFQNSEVRQRALNSIK